MASAGIFDGDTLASAVPASVDEIGFGTALLHLLDELFRVFGWMEFEEGLAEAGREGRGWLGDAALSAGEFGGEARKEIVLGLLWGKDRDRWEDAKGVGGEEDNALSSWGAGDWADDVLDVVDRIGDAGVLGDGLVGEVDLAVFIEGDVL